MSEENINLLKVQLFLNYYKNNITDNYVRCIDNIVLDNNVLNNLNERVYITTLDNYNNLQQELTEYTGKIKVLEHNCKQAEESCRKHRLSNKNKNRRIKRKEEKNTKLQQELTKYKERNENAIEKLEALIAFWKKYNPIDNYMQVEQFKGVISILEDKENINE